jgi:hypothetical protein
MTLLNPMVTTSNGPRLAGKPDVCFYCGRKVGQEHTMECVCRRRVVVFSVRHKTGTFEWATMSPASWTKEDHEFHKNESSWCMDNIYGSGSFKLCPPEFAFPPRSEDPDRGECVLCFFTEFTYLRDATDEDMRRFRVTEWPEYIEDYAEQEQVT